jgi:hypothetical protein
MAENEARKSYPILPISQWWALRKKFKKSIPGVVTDTYLSAALNMGIKSARNNVLPYLKTLGIIDSEGKPTERAKLWRDDEHYPAECKAILESVYPEELRSAVPDPTSERDKASRWFAQHTGAGTNAVNKMVSVYCTLAEADVTKQPEQDRKPSPKVNASKPTEARKKNTVASNPATQSQTNTTKGTKVSANSSLAGDELIDRGPELNINLQIHISADASPDQIDQIFASMSKHLYKSKE